MKRKHYKLFFLISAHMVFIAANATAANHIITVTDFQFTPDTMTVATGDSITWQWESGFHTTTSNGIPSGAEQWNVVLDSAHTTFTYVVTLTGTYHYISVPDLPAMTGKFTIPGPVGIAPVENNNVTFNLLSNPVHDHVVINYSSSENASVDIALYNISGARLQTFLHETIPSGKYQEAFSLVNSLPVGMYFVRLQVGNLFLTRKIMIE